MPHTCCPKMGNPCPVCLEFIDDVVKLDENDERMIALAQTMSSMGSLTMLGAPPPGSPTVEGTKPGKLRRAATVKSLDPTVTMGSTTDSWFGSSSMRLASPSPN